MKKSQKIFLFCKLILIVNFIFFSLINFVKAGSIDYLSSQSAEFVRTQSRNASLDAIDIISSNPAGSVRIEEGIYLNISNQSFKSPWSIEYAGKEYKNTADQLLVPSLFTLYRKNNYSAFFAITIPAGGGMLNYKDGVPQMVLLTSLNPLLGNYQGGKLKADSYYIGYTVGGAYAFNEKVSVSLSFRFIDAKNNYEGEATYSTAGTLELDAKKEAKGLGLILGVNYLINDKWNVAFTYEAETSLKFETSVNKNTFLLPSFTDGEKQNRNLPAMLRLGAEYKINEKLIASTSLNYYFIKDADSKQDSATLVNSYPDDYDNGWEIGYGMIYKLNDDFDISGGLLYTKSGGNDKALSDFEYALDSYTLGTGLKYQIKENICLNFGLSYSIYKSEENSYGEKFNKGNIDIALGGEFRF